MLLLLALQLYTVTIKAQFADSALFRPNVVRWNITPFLISGPDSWVLGYERVIKKNQSISLNLGTMSLPFQRNSRDSSLINFVEGRNRGFLLRLIIGSISEIAIAMTLLMEFI